MTLINGVLIVYIILLSFTALGFSLKTRFKGRQKSVLLPITIITCARNEEKNIGLFLKTLLNQNYDLSLIELILIDDASDDLTANKAKMLLKNSPVSYRIISNTIRKGKKQSLSEVIPNARHELILIRDADTFTLSSNYIQSIADFYTQFKCDLIIGPVAIANSFGLLWSLQAIENSILAIVTCGSSYFNQAFLCNGANLIFTKSLFQKTGGYSSHLTVSGGEDIFLLEDAKKADAKIQYLKSKDALVYTYPFFSFTRVLNQKIRWSSKFKSNTNLLNRVFALTVFFCNFCWLICLALLTVPPYQMKALMFITLKVIFDILLLLLSLGFIKNKSILWYSIPALFLYPFYAVMVGLGAVFVKPKWK